MENRREFRTSWPENNNNNSNPIRVALVNKCNSSHDFLLQSKHHFLFFGYLDSLRAQ